MKKSASPETLKTKAVGSLRDKNEVINVTDVYCFAETNFCIASQNP